MTNLNITATVTLIGSLLVAGVVALVAMSAFTIGELKVGGPIFDRISIGKDLVADILPPPEYIIESYLEVTLALNNPASVETHRKRLAELHKDYDERRSYWATQNIDKTIISKLTVTSDGYVRQFWDELDRTFLPALARGDTVAAARSYGELTKFYLAHREVIDDVVKDTDRLTAEVEAAAAHEERTLTIGEYALAALVLLSVIGCVVALVRWLVRPIVGITAAISQLAQGRLDVEIPTVARHDEIGQMIRAAASIAATLKGVAGDLGAMIDAARAGTLSARTDPSTQSGEFSALLLGVNDLVEILTAPLFEVAAVMAKLASGDVRGRMSGAYEGDLRALKGNVNRSLDGLVTLLDEISAFAGAMAAGDITRSIGGSYQGDFAAIKVNLNKAAAQLRSVIGAVATSTRQVAISATETSAAAIDVSRHAASQMVTLAEVSSAIEQTAAAVSEIARSAERGSTLAGEAATAALDGQTKLGHLSGAVEGIRKGTARIGQISSLISTIADKTYVLALNAGLEATRAGDHGRGFGLIAHQITKLAEDVAQATRDIRTLIDEAADNVQLGVAATEAAGVAMTRIVGSARESGVTVQAIAAAIDEQNAMTQVLKDQVTHLRMVGQTTAGASEEISATMAALTEMAQHLRAEADGIKYL
jgi:methyl-accepting chemotaxis protein